MAKGLELYRFNHTYPQMRIAVLVRGGEVLNDSTVEDAMYAGIDSTAEIISSGVAVSYIDAVNYLQQ